MARCIIKVAAVMAILRQVPLVCLIITGAGNFVRVLIITCRKRKELLTVHRSAGGGGDVTELGQHALSALKVELSLLCFDKALVQVGMT